MPEYYDTAVLAASFDRRIAPGTDLLDLAFEHEFQSQTEEIVFDEIRDDEMLAQYVSPNVATPDGKLVTQAVKSFKPSYVKERNTIKPSVGLLRQSGESLSGDQNRDAGGAFEVAVEKQLDVHQNRITRTEIKQANELVQAGKVTIKGKNYPERIVDFNRNAALTDVLTSGNKWGDSNVSVADYIEERSDTMGTIGGASGRVMVLGSSAKRRFVSDEGVKDALDNRRAAGGVIEFGAIGTSKTSVMAYVGTYGDLEVFKYVQTYVDENGVRQHFFPTDGMAILDPSEFFGIRCYGAILDKKAGLKALKRFPKVFDEEDPSGTIALTQSSPLMASGNVDASCFSLV